MHLKCTQESVQQRPALLAVGLNCPLDGASFASFRIIHAEDAEDALRNLGHEEEVAVLLLGPRLKPMVALSILDRYSSILPGNATAAVLLCAGSEPELFQTLVNEGHIFYMARGDLAPEQLRSIVTCAAGRFLSKRKGVTDSFTTQAARIDELLDYCMRLPMQEDLPSAAGLLTTTARQLINAEHVQYLVYDAENETLTRADALDHREWGESAASGLAAFVARTGQPTRLDGVGLDPRYDAEIDNPSGPEDVQFLAVPLIGPQGMPAGVITATRNRESSRFSEEEALLLELLAECAAPTINQIALQNRVQALLLKRAEGTSSDLFREEALEHHVRSRDQHGGVLKTLPSWLRSTYWVTLVVFFAGLIVTLVSKMNVYASGPAVIKAHAVINVLAADAGEVRSIAVSAGDTVRAGDVLAVVGATHSPDATSSAEKLKATTSGIVGDINIRPGQSVKAGDPITNIVEPGAGYDLIAFLPYSYSAQLHQGMAMRLKMRGKPDSGRTVLISRVGPEILDPAGAARYAGKDDASTLPVAGRVVVVRGLLPEVSFGSDSLNHGVGEVEIIIRSEPAIVTLIPGLRKLFRNAE
jgi:GAF domain-containing protein